MLAIWLGIDLLRARHQLEAARAGFLSVQAQVDKGDLAGARAQLNAPAAASHRAGSIVGGLPFRIYSHVPGVSAPVRELRTLAQAVDGIGNQVLPTLLNSDLRVPRWNGSIDARPFVSAQQPLAKADAQLSAVLREVAGIKPSGIGALTRAREQLEAQLTTMARTVREADVAAHVVPALSGQSGRQRYFVALQNNAEARSTGGLLGAYAILDIDHGKLRLEHVGQNDELKDPPKPVLDLGADYNRRYGRLESTSTWRSANLSPDVPTVGRLLAALWQSQTGERVDGVVLLDPIALGELISATGPVALSDGTELDESNTAKVLLSGVYARYPSDSQAPRYSFLAETARQAFTALSTRQLDGRKVVRQFARAASSGHLQLWASAPAVQKTLLRSRIAGQLAVDGPFLSVVTNDVGGSKLDFYQHRTVTYDARSTGIAVDLGDGPQLEEEGVVTVALDNEAPAGLPNYVVLRPDDPGAPRGQSNTYVSVYAGKGATLLDATLDGRPVQLESDVEDGLAVYSLTLPINPGQRRTLRLHVRQPARAEQTLLYRQQPLFRNDVVQVRRRGSRVPVTYVYAAP